jgi:hypothetical protein
MRELADGIAFWRSRPWPADLHNADYEMWARQNPNGNLSLAWWQEFQLPRPASIRLEPEASACLHNPDGWTYVPSTPPRM